MSFFPQINSNGMMVQLPNSSGYSYESLQGNLESGMRFAFPRRAGNLSGFPNKPLSHFTLNYPNISDVERETLRAFFNSQRGRWGIFSLLDPGGNVLQYSEDFTQTYWNKVTATVSGSLISPDPFGKTLGSIITGIGSNSHLLGVIGPSAGGIIGFVVNVSVWLKPTTSFTIFLGVANSTFTTLTGQNHAISANVWQRIETTVVLPDNNQFRFCLGGNSTWTSQVLGIFGAQAVPSKGSGGYLKTPFQTYGYGYYPTVRFDTDNFTVRQDQPGQNAVQLSVVEVFVP
jgi:hypothetical protein